MPKKLMKANLNPKVEIKERDRGSYHVLLERTNVNPRDPKNPVKKFEVKPIRVNDYRKFFSGSTENQIRFRKAMGVDTIVVVHDPTLGKTELPKPISGPIIEPVKVEAVKPEPTKIISEEEKIDAAIKSELNHVEKKKVIRRKPIKTK